MGPFFCCRRQMGISRLIGTRAHRYKSLMAALSSFLFPHPSALRLSRSSHINGSPLPFLFSPLPPTPQLPKRSPAPLLLLLRRRRRGLIQEDIRLLPLPSLPPSGARAKDLSFPSLLHIETYFLLVPPHSTSFFLSSSPAGFVWSARISLQSRGGGQIAAEAEAP